ncbi:MAG: MarR family transcriptional regulator [Planctomycetales bacterium]|nr:MarR family transcriptional regulator [Planctomycetales bacterium]
MSPTIIERLGPDGRARVLRDLLGEPNPEGKVRCLDAGKHKNGDAHPSMQVNAQRGGVKCFACGLSLGLLDVTCRVRALGRRADAARWIEETYLGGSGSNGKPHAEGEGGSSIPPINGATAQHPGCTLGAYGEAKRLPLDFLREIGLSDLSLRGRPAVRIPYRSQDGGEAAVRFRIALDAKDKFRWRKGSKPILYGLWRLDDVRKAGAVTLVEGESDSQTLWLHGFPALGLPGATTWREEWAPLLDGIATIYVLVEPDTGGEAVLAWVARSKIRDRVRLVRLPAATKDPSALYLSDPARFRERWEAALAAARPWTEEESSEARGRAAIALGRCGDLARERDILDKFATAVEQAGVVGESRAAKLLYLSVTSRLLARPVSVVVKGPSSAGKSFVVERVLVFFPLSAYYALSAMSERALAYSEEPLSHRMLVVYEAVGLKSEFASYLVRSLLSEGRLRYETVEKTKDGLRPRLIEREGPTGLLVTTTAVRLHPENETRLLSVPVTDTQEQTKAVLLACAKGAADSPDPAPWIALQEWQAAEHAKVVVPYAEALAKLIPPVAVRLRRDFGAVLRLVEAHALLHRATRERDPAGRVVATLADYAAVRELVAALLADAAERTVSPEVREAVEKVCALGPGPVSVAKLAAALHLDKSAASRRASRAEDRGFLRNEEERKGRPARYVLGDPLPEDEPLLPSPEALLGEDRCTVAPLRGGIDTPSPPPTPPDREPGQEG